jgi:hypothetical protein
MCLLLALKIEHPRSVHLIRGNHEAADINALFGFRCGWLGAHTALDAQGFLKQIDHKHTDRVITS